jgi:putative transposase
MNIDKIKAIRGYKAPRHIVGRIIASNKLQREFTVDQPNRVWVTDVTYIRTWQGWLYLAVVMDLYARNVVGWSMKPTLARELVLDALMMAMWRRRPHSACSCTRLKARSSAATTGCASVASNNREPYKTRELAKADVFDYIEVFYNRTRCHSHLGGLSPEAFERASP